MAPSAPSSYDVAPIDHLQRDDDDAARLGHLGRQRGGRVGDEHGPGHGATLSREPGGDAERRALDRHYAVRHGRVRCVRQLRQHRLRATPVRRPPTGPPSSPTSALRPALVNRWVQQAREAERPTFRGIVGDYLGSPTPTHLPGHRGAVAGVRARQRPGGARRVAGPCATHQVIGVTGYRHRGPFGIAELVAASDPDGYRTPRPGNVARVTAAEPARTGGPASATARSWCWPRTATPAWPCCSAARTRTTSGATCRSRSSPTGPRPAARVAARAAGAHPRAQRLPRPGGVVRPLHVRRARLGAALPLRGSWCPASR